jgi:hypothetical protein
MGRSTVEIYGAAAGPEIFAGAFAPLVAAPEVSKVKDSDIDAIAGRYGLSNDWVRKAAQEAARKDGMILVDPYKYELAALAIADLRALILG